MKPRKLLLALALLALPFSMSAQCNFLTDNNHPPLEYIQQTVGTTALQWKLDMGKSNGTYYLLVSVADESANKHKMGSNDRVFLDLASGERLSFTPAAVVEPYTILGNKVATFYDTRFEISREEMEKLSTTPLDGLAALIDNREIKREVKDGQPAKIMEAATCVLK